MDSKKTEDSKSDDLSPSTPFTKFCLSTLPSLSNFSVRAEEAEVIIKEEEKTKNNYPVCGCARTKCLKLYCECFSNNRYCVECNCKNCKNKPEFTEMREKARKATIERNPAAFREDISDTYKACHCKRSGCKKKYCECFEYNRTCTANCKCEGCKNLPDQ
jgi:Tesmin/TSO1-like CXC domain, cysteine-rich domain